MVDYDREKGYSKGGNNREQRDRSQKQKEGRAVNRKEGDAYFYNLGHAIGKLASRERLQESSINEDVFRLPEGANQILPMGRVDGSLAANARVNHGEQSGRDLYETASAHTALITLEITHSS